MGCLLRVVAATSNQGAIPTLGGGRVPRASTRPPRIDHARKQETETQETNVATEVARLGTNKCEPPKQSE